jgi:nitronate monooxygenase
MYPDFRKAMVLKATDGGSSTLKSNFNDDIAKSALWGHLYDGRAIMTAIHEKFLSGSTLEECLKSLDEDYKPDEAVKLINCWAGTGVGLVDKAQPAAKIVQEVRDAAKETIRALAGSV